MTSTAADIVTWVPGPGPDSLLRHAVRTWQVHLPHGRLWVAGAAPRWMTGHHTLDAPGPLSEETVWRAAATSPEVSDPVLVVPPHALVLAPVGEAGPAPVHRGPIAHVSAWCASRRVTDAWTRGLAGTRMLIGQLGERPGSCWEVPVPMLVERALVRRVLGLVDDAGLEVCPHLRTLYAHAAGLSGERIVDPAVTRPGAMLPLGAAYAAPTSDVWARGRVGAAVRREFAGPSRYERS